MLHVGLKENRKLKNIFSSGIGTLKEKLKLKHIFRWHINDCGKHFTITVIELASNLISMTKKKYKQKSFHR